MAISKNVIFQYKTQKGPLHKLPAVLKFLFLLPMSVICMSLPLTALGPGIFILILAGFYCGFSLREQLADLKPALFYAALMYALSFFSSLLESLQTISLSALNANIFLPQPRFIFIAMRLVIIVQLSALLFRTTSAIELRGGISSIEVFIRRLLSCLPVLGKRIPLKASYSQSIALFLGFIPEVFETWRQLNLAWHGRAGKQGMRKIKALVFVLISLSMEKAARKANAIEARKG